MPKNKAHSCLISHDLILMLILPCPHFSCPWAHALYKIDIGGQLLLFFIASHAMSHIYSSLSPHVHNPCCIAHGHATCMHGHPHYSLGHPPSGRWWGGRRDIPLPTFFTPRGCILHATYFMLLFFYVLCIMCFTWNIKYIVLSI